MPIYISRTLAYKDPKNVRQIISQDDIVSLSEPVVILGDPGLGKSELTKTLGTLPDMHYIRAGTFERAAEPGLLVAEGERPVIDGLDEIASAAPGGAVEAVLKKLSAMGSPPFVLSCREADWKGAADRVKIEDDYGAAPVLFHLQPFTWEDAHDFLSGEFPAIDVDELQGILDQRGLEGLYGNPLTLRMLGEVMQEEGVLPETRAQLFDRACRVMLKESNPRHHNGAHVRRSEDELLLTAGAICATLLLCDREGVHTGPVAEVPSSFLNIAEMAGILDDQAAEDALRTRLFQAEGENRFVCVHRMVAEYLGAKWLARCFEDGISGKRIFALFRQGEGVPTSLRGLHAWLAHFSDVLATRCIDADSYAVLRYGDAETLSLDQARTLLATLKALSEKDPYFRSEDWGHHPASGLMRMELQDDILAIVRTPRCHTHLTLLLLEAMEGTRLGAELASTLETMLFDRDYYFSERSDIAAVVFAADQRDEWEEVICRLLDMNDAESARLAFDFLKRVGVGDVSLGTVIETVLAYFGLAPGQDPASMSNTLRHVPDNLFDDLRGDQLEELLDGLVEHAQPLLDDADHSTQTYVADLARLLMVRALETGSAIEPERLWGWIAWADGHDGYDHDTRQRLAELLGGDRAMRASLMEHVLLTPCEENTWMAGHRLGETGLDLYPTGEEIADVLRALRARFGDSRIDIETWRGLLLHGRSAEGLKAVVRAAAIEAANDDPELISVIDDVSEVVVPEWRIRRGKENAKANAKRRLAIQRHRDDLNDRSAEVAVGNVDSLVLPACVYLGRPFTLDPHHDFDPGARPVERLREFLGDDLSDRVLAGFVAVLDRDDLPSASEIVEVHCQNRYWEAEAPMICGIAELLRQGCPINGIDRDKLVAVYMAWQRMPLPENVLRHLDIGPPLEAVLFTSEADWEEYFRTSIEPQLALNLHHIDDLYRLVHEFQLPKLAGRLTIEWLCAYPGLVTAIQERLLDCALQNAGHDERRTLVINNREAVHETVRLWKSADYVADFDDCSASLEMLAAEDPEFLWSIRDRVGPQGNERFDRLSIGQLVFIVENFGAHWSIVPIPTGVITGTRNGWHACEFIRSTIYAIANNPSPEATEALQRLIVDSRAPSYDDTLKHALALQLKARRDFEYKAPSVGEMRAIMTDGLPETIDDMRAYFADRIETLKNRMRGSNTDMWAAYWIEDRPRDEPFCRNRMIEHISGQLPESIRFEPEMHMPGQTRTDIAAIRNHVGLPVEIKGQWHPDVWDAASDQLDARYTRDWRAEGRGAYIVLWFDDVPGKQLRPHPEGQTRPETPEELCQMLIDRLPEERRTMIDVHVIDISRLV